MCVSFKFNKWFNHKVIFLQIRDLIPVLFVLGIMLSLGTIWRSHHLNLLILFYHCKSLKWSCLLVSYCFVAFITIDFHQQSSKHALFGDLLHLAFSSQLTVHNLALVIFLCLRTSKDLSVGELDRAFLHIILLAFLHHIVIIFSHYLLKKYSNTPIMLHLQHSSMFCRKGRKGPKSFYNGECQETVVVVTYGGTRP